MENKNAVLKVTAIMFGIIAVCVILSILIGVPTMKKMKYSNALSNAEKGNYITAVSELSGKTMDDYKDVKNKRQEYSLEAAKQYIENDDIESAESAIEYCISVDNESDYAERAEKLLGGIKK